MLLFAAERSAQDTLMRSWMPRFALPPPTVPHADKAGWEMDSGLARGRLEGPRREASARHKCCAQRVLSATQSTTVSLFVEQRDAIMRVRMNQEQQRIERRAMTSQAPRNRHRLACDKDQPWGGRRQPNMAAGPRPS